MLTSSASSAGQAAAAAAGDGDGSVDGFLLRLTRRPKMSTNRKLTQGLLFGRGELLLQRLEAPGGLEESLEGTLLCTLRRLDGGTS